MTASPLVVVLSGGQDSTTCLFWAKAHHSESPLHTISFDYGQRHRRELEAAARVSEMAGAASHRLVSVVDTLRSVSPLTSESTLETYADAESMDKIIGTRIEKTFVPLRNPLFLLIAANHALALGAPALITGVCAMDNANYPDCRPEFLSAAEALFRAALGAPPYPQLWAPLLYLTKAESVKLAQEIGALPALAYSHTCYAGEYPPCGKCHACVLRASGFAEAGIPDPLVERAKTEGLL